MTAAGPGTLERAGIAARIPHSGSMCLLDAMLRWSTEEIVCRIVGHDEPTHPLRLDGELPAAAALEFASQATALHGALCAPSAAGPRPGFLASARGVRLHVARLDDRPGPFEVRATRQAGNDAQALYQFELRDGTGAPLADGRLTVVFGHPLTAASA